MQRSTERAIKAYAAFKFGRPFLGCSFWVATFVTDCSAPLW